MKYHDTLRIKEENMSVDYRKTISYGCRYGDIAEPLFISCNYIFENSEDNDSGHVSLVGLICDSYNKEYRVITLDYDYGSCSWCDEWDDRGLYHSEILQDMAKTCSEMYPICDFIKIVDSQPKYKWLRENPQWIEFLLKGEGENEPI